MLQGVLGKCTGVLRQDVTSAKSKGLQNCKGWGSHIQLGDREKLPKQEPLHWVLKGGRTFASDGMETICRIKPGIQVVGEEHGTEMFPEDRLVQVVWHVLK